MSEIKNREPLEALSQRPEADNFRQIKPENDISIEKCAQFWDRLFVSGTMNETFVNPLRDVTGKSKMNEENQDSSKVQDEMKEPDGVRRDVVDGKFCYYDDNEKLYRVENDLIPGNEYEINGYKYQTDEQGRIVSAEGKLHLKGHEGRLPIRDSIEDIGKGDQMEGDDRGHLIGDQFDGSNGLENMIPQNAYINRNDFKNFENELAKEVKAEKEVIVNVEPIYDGDSRRPDGIAFEYAINGERGIRLFPNEER